MRNKEILKKSFEKITMPQYLEKNILNMVENKSNKQSIFIKFSTVTAVIAIILTMGITGVFAHSFGLFDFLLANKDVTPEQQELVQQTNLEAIVEGVTFKSREFLFDGNNLYIRVEVKSKENKFVAGDDEVSMINPEKYKAIGVGLLGGEIVHNRVDWNYEDDGTLIYIIKAETKSLGGIKIRFAVNDIDEKGKRKNGDFHFTELYLVKYFKENTPGSM
ncbi:MAG TPA: DUF4179 domain-containing protein [Pseudobacteroides sp.]|nr:DUF4179 domain-containing protein [Pseudobacteroides sp.]